MPHSNLTPEYKKLMKEHIKLLYSTERLTRLNKMKYNEDREKILNIKILRLKEVEKQRAIIERTKI